MNDSMVELRHSEMCNFENTKVAETPEELAKRQGFLDFHNHIQRLSDNQMLVFVLNCMETSLDHVVKYPLGSQYYQGVMIGVSCLDDKFKPEGLRNEDARTAV